ncbi:MAG: oligosaccharide flippase family protein, partial [Candidatus Competibacteraceae bacterium]|nr:oligosaccharide flippase family protein [Candidatus Competibacteraceae bacterium]
MALKANVAANFAGQAWRGLLAFAFIPVYIRYLGVEAYGLIAVYAVLLAWLSLFDMGLRPALNREMARFLGGERSAEHIRDLLRSIELIAVGIAVAAAAAIWAASGWIATGWLNARGLPA